MLLLHISQLAGVAFSVLILLISITDGRLQAGVEAGLASTHRILRLLHRHLLRGEFLRRNEVCLVLGECGVDHVAGGSRLIHQVILALLVDRATLRGH